MILGPAPVGPGEFPEPPELPLCIDELSLLDVELGLELLPEESLDVMIPMPVEEEELVSDDDIKSDEDIEEEDNIEEDDDIEEDDEIEEDEAESVDDEAEELTDEEEEELVDELLGRIMI